MRTPPTSSLFDLTDPKGRERFIANVVESRENGFEQVCAECGTGLYDESDMHARGCSKVPEGGYVIR